MASGPARTCGGAPTLKRRERRAPIATTARTKTLDTQNDHRHGRSMHFSHRLLTQPAAESPAAASPLAAARFFAVLRVPRLVRWAALSALLLTPVVSFAAQFVLFDVTFTFTKEDADNSKPSQSHYYVKGAALNPERPRDWTAPIDYRHGTVHLRTEVLEKPAGGEPTTWSICYIPNRGQGNGYGCTGTDLYREKGVYEKDIAMTAFWQNDAIVWAVGIKQMDLVMKDGSGGGGHVHKRSDPQKFFPTKLRITAVQVSAGSTYDPSQVPNLAPKTGANGGQP